MIVAGLVIVAVTVISGVAGVVANGGHTRAVAHSAILGYHMTGSTGSVFLYGAAVGALAMLGLSLWRPAPAVARGAVSRRAPRWRSPAARPPPSPSTATT